MAEPAAAGDWRDEIRPEVEAAWDALDRAQLIMYRQYKETGDEAILRFKERLAHAANEVIGVSLDDLYPPEDEPEDDCTEG